MRVLAITPLFPPAVGGAATYFGGVVPHLAGLPEIEQLVVLTERMPGQSRESAQQGYRLLRYLPTRVSVPQRPWLIHAISYVRTQLWFAVCLGGVVRRYGIDVLHFHTRFRGGLFYGAVRRTGVPVVADLRDKMTDPSQLVDVADRLLCNAEGVQRFAVHGGFPAERTVQIPTTFDPPEIPSARMVEKVRAQYSLGNGQYVVYVGDMNWSKGVYDLLDAYEEWRSGHPRVSLVMVGTNREGERFLSRVRVAKGVTYLGSVPHHEALSLIRGAEVVVLPSRSEGLPSVILEAVALGRKTICPPGIPEFGRHMPESTLPEVSVAAIRELLDRVWASGGTPSYPLPNHQTGRVVDEIVSVYRGLLRQTTGPE